MRAVEYEELASDAQRVGSGDRLFLLQYRLVRERLADGAETHFVRCYQRELHDGQPVGGEVEVAGLGPDAAEARTIYGLLVSGGAMPVHLQDIVREQRCGWAHDGVRGWHQPFRGGGRRGEPEGPDGMETGTN